MRHVGYVMNTDDSYRRRTNLAIAARLAHFENLRALISERFVVDADRQTAIRRDTVAKYVASRLRRGVSVTLRNEVTEVITILMGGDVTQREGRRLYLRVRDKSMSPKATAELSAQLLRHRE